MTWRNDRTGIGEIEVDEITFDVLVEFDDDKTVDSSKRMRAVLIGSARAYAGTSFDAKLNLAEQLERLAIRIRNKAKGW